MARISKQHGSYNFNLEREELELLRKLGVEHSSSSSTALELSADVPPGDRRVCLYVVKHRSACTHIQYEKGELRRFKIWSEIMEEYPRFGPTEIEFTLDEDVPCLYFDMPSLQELPWPSYKNCASYDMVSQASIDYLKRAVNECLNGVTVPKHLWRLLPGLVVNFANQGRAREALDCLVSGGLSSLEEHAKKIRGGA